MLHVVRHEIRRLRVLLVVGLVPPALAVISRWLLKGDPGDTDSLLAPSFMLAAPVVVGLAAATWAADLREEARKVLLAAPLSRSTLWAGRLATAILLACWTLAWAWVGVSMWGREWLAGHSGDPVFTARFVVTVTFAYLAYALLAAAVVPRFTWALAAGALLFFGCYLLLPFELMQRGAPGQMPGLSASRMLGTPLAVLALAGSLLGYRALGGSTRQRLGRALAPLIAGLTALVAGWTVLYVLALHGVFPVSRVRILEVSRAGTAALVMAYRLPVPGVTGRLEGARHRTPCYIAGQTMLVGLDTRRSHPLKTAERETYWLSPRGRWLERYPWGRPEDRDIYVVGREGLRRLAMPLPGLAEGYRPLGMTEFSPDERFAALQMEDRQGQEPRVFVVVDRGGRIRLSCLASQVSDLTWAPGSDSCIFRTLPASQFFGDRRVAIGSQSAHVWSPKTDLRPLALPTGARVHSFSPDGRLLLLERKQGNRERHELVVWEWRRGRVSGRFHYPSHPWGSGPVWTPDSRGLLFFNLEGSQVVAWLYPAAGGRPTRKVLGGPAPDWVTRALAPRPSSPVQLDQGTGWRRGRLVFVEFRGDPAAEFRWWELYPRLRALGGWHRIPEHVEVLYRAGWRGLPYHAEGPSLVIAWPGERTMHFDLNHPERWPAMPRPDVGEGER